jgi:RNA polymerase sigma-70 factor (ECF subfamily)
MRVDPRSDAELLRAARRDPAAFGVFYDRHADAVLAYFTRRTADAQTAADLTGETFAQAFASRRRFRSMGAPATAWLFAIARHELNHWLRRRAVEDRARRRLGLERLELDDEAIARIEELADLPALQAAVAGALAQLPPGLAEAVALRVRDELPYDVVASSLGCSEAAARVRVSRGLTRMADLLRSTTGDVS